MIWAILIIVIFVCCLVLIGGLYAAKRERQEPTSQSPDEGTTDSEDAEAGE